MSLFFFGAAFFFLLAAGFCVPRTDEDVCGLETFIRVLRRVDVVMVAEVAAMEGAKAASRKK